MEHAGLQLSEIMGQIGKLSVLYEFNQIVMFLNVAVITQNN